MKNSIPTTRLANLRQQLTAQGVDCLALLPGANLRYLTGLHFHLLMRSLIAFFPADANAEPVLVIPAFDKLKWETEAPFTARTFAWSDEESLREAMHQTVAALPEIRTLAVEHLRMRVQEHSRLREHFPDATISQGEPLLNALRIHKNTDEVAAMRHACEIAEKALEEVISSLSPGMTEHEVANQLQATMLLTGGGPPPFEPVVLAGSRSAQIHGTPGQRVIEAGDLLLIDFGTTVDGYACDITRTFAVGQEPDEQVRLMYEAVKAGNAAGRAAVKPGVNASEVHHAARQPIEARGMGKLFTHGTGHGLGLDIHEPPFIMEDNNIQLETGMTFTVEPGVYDQELGGIRIEDNVVVTRDGSETLTSFGRELRVIGL